MGRKPKEKDIAEYLWHSEPKQINETNDNWRIRYGYLDSNGKEHQTTETVNSKLLKDQFVEFLTKREKEHRDSLKRPEAIKSETNLPQTISELLSAYSIYQRHIRATNPKGKRGWSESTWNSSRGRINNYISPLIGELRIWELTTIDLEIWRERLSRMAQSKGNHKSSKGNVTPETISDCEHIISGALTYAQRTLHVLDKNPMNDYERTHVTYEPRQVWTQEQFFTAYENCDDILLKTILTLAVALSSRTSEHLALTWDDFIDNSSIGKQSYLRVYKAFVYIHPEYFEEQGLIDHNVIFTFPKMPGTPQKSNRRMSFYATKTRVEKNIATDSIPISPEVVEYLHTYRDWQNEIKKAAGDAYSDFNLIIARENGWFIDADMALKKLRQLSASLGLPRVTDYSMRHLSATLKLELSDHNYNSVRKDTGHRSVTMLQKHYDIPEDRVRNQTNNAVGKILLGKEKSEPPQQNGTDIEEKLKSILSTQEGQEMIELFLEMINKKNNGK